ncbi:retrovirus-related Pol polyprotein from transposon 412 [Trichonephila clavipes]|nr:retrovirus-related Pol polyprotein from transposon 412 [Trichonephila clavipes]
MQVSPVPACEECPRSACLPFFPEKDKEEVSVFSPAMLSTMAFLLKQTKEVLLEVAIDLGVEVNSTLTKSEIKNRICQSEDYNEESVKSLLEGILAEKQEARELKERQEARELMERQEARELKERQEARALKERQEARELKERQEARELKERQETREYELERLRLSNATETVSVSSADLEGQGKGKRRTKRSLNLRIPPSEGGEDDSFIIPAFEGEGGKSLAKVNGVEFKEEQRKCPDLKPLWDKAQTGIDKEFRVIRGKLVRVAKTKRGEEGGHLGVTKTKDRILRHFFWPNVYRDVEEFVKTCDSCQRVGKPRDKAKAPLKLVPIISEVFSKINIDAVGPLPVSTKQNRYLITSICVASKYPEAIPVESITSPNVIDALLSIFSKIGFPREIQSDLGTSFTSELTTTFFNRFGIKVTRSSVSHPQSNAVERVHRTIKRVIKALCVESGEDWEGVLPLVLFSLRTVAHESTGFSPTELVMGKNLRTPQTLVYEEWMEEGNTSQSVVEYILQLNNRLKRCQDIAITRMKECQLKRKTWYDRDVVERKFVEGDLVMVLVTSKQNKLEVNWIGPGKLVSLVVEEVSDDIEGDAEIPYPDKQCTKFDYHEILRESQLQLKLSPSQIDELKQVITKNKDVFSPDPGTTHLTRIDIELISDKPIKTKPYRMSPRQINILREEIKLESPNKDLRPCVDYRRLNEITRAEFFPFAKYGRDSRKSECGSLCNGDGFVERLLSDSAHAELRDTQLSLLHLAPIPQENDVRVMGYYSHYIPNYSTIASPLTDALKGKIKKEKITWDEKCGKAFEELKAKLVTQPILFAPDFATEFILQTDASEVGAGVVLSQRIEGEEHPIVFLSKKFSKAERNYSTVERELAAIILV